MDVDHSRLIADEKDAYALYLRMIAAFRFKPEIVEAARSIWQEAAKAARDNKTDTASGNVAFSPTPFRFDLKN